MASSESLKQRSGGRIVPEDRAESNNTIDAEEEETKTHPRHHERRVSHLTIFGLFIVMSTLLCNSTNVVRFVQASFARGGFDQRYVVAQGERRTTRQEGTTKASNEKAGLRFGVRSPGKRERVELEKDRFVVSSQVKREGKQEEAQPNKETPRKYSTYGSNEKTKNKEMSKKESHATEKEAGEKPMNEKAATRKTDDTKPEPAATQHVQKGRGSNQNTLNKEAGEKPTNEKAASRKTDDTKPEPAATQNVQKGRGSNRNTLKKAEKDQENKESSAVVKEPSNTIAMPGPEEKCTPWEISLDDWWQANPTWEPSFENDTHACFRPIQNQERVQVLQKAYSLQFNGCKKKPAIRHSFEMGFAATMLFHLNSAFWSAYREDRQFIPGIAHEGWKWLYEPQDPNSWAHCPTHDHECLFLPITNCPRPVGGKEEKPKKKYQFRDMENNETLVEHNIWLSHYLMRPRQIFRKKLYDYMRDAKGIPQVQKPCTWMHVRRADAMTETNYKRNYYLLKEYLTRGEISPQDHILLLTDDQSTIEEAHLLHPEYQWSYWDRKRHRGPVHNNAHIPSGDQAFEVLTIMAERKLASQCSKGVFGKSNMATLFRNAMALEQPGGYQNLTLVQIDAKSLKKIRIEPEDFVRELDQQLDAARKKLQQQKAAKQ